MKWETLAACVAVGIGAFIAGALLDVEMVESAMIERPECGPEVLTL